MKENRRLCRWLAALLAAAVLVGAGAALRWTFRMWYGGQGSALERTDLPGYAPVPNDLPAGAYAAENHCTEPGAVTLTDDAGRCWRVSAEGWNLQWVQTNGVGAVINARNVRTGATHSFYLGAQADSFDFFPQKLGEELYADPLGTMRKTLGRLWRVCGWTESGFRDFTGGMRVEAISPGEVGQRVALGNGLDLQQDAGFSGNLLLVEDTVTAPELTLRQEEPADLAQAPQTRTYTNADGLTWTLRWQDFQPGETLRLAAGCETGDWLEIWLYSGFLEYKGITTQEQALEEVFRALDHISRRAPA